MFAIAISAVGFSLIVGLSLALARKTRSYTYRRFFQHLLGRAWFLYEMSYIVFVLIALAVLGAASGELTVNHLGIDRRYGIASLLILITLLVFGGTPIIEKVLSRWSFFLVAVFGIFFVLYLGQYGDEMKIALANTPNNGPWLTNSFRYVGYSIIVVPAILFCARHLESSRDAFLAGALAGPIAMVPAVFIYLPILSTYPDILSAPVPTDFMMQRLDIPWLQILYYVVVLGTLVQTGAALLHSINDRVAEACDERGHTMPRWLRPAASFGVCLLVIVLADTFGIVVLIANGYGTLAWAFICLYVFPLFTRGIWMICTKTKPLLEISMTNERPLQTPDALQKTRKSSASPIGLGET